MDRDYYINRIVLNGYLNNPIYKPIQMQIKKFLRIYAI